MSICEAEDKLETHCFFQERRAGRRAPEVGPAREHVKRIRKTRPTAKPREPNQDPLVPCHAPVSETRRRASNQ
jgi:hypothetical protein